MKPTHASCILVFVIMVVGATTMAYATDQPPSPPTPAVKVLKGLISDSRALSKVVLLNITEAARLTTSIIQRLDKTPWSQAGLQKARKCGEAYQKTLLNLGNPSVPGGVPPAQISYCLAHYGLGELYAIETGKPNPFAGFLWECIDGQLQDARVFSAALIRAAASPYLQAEARDLAAWVLERLRITEQLMQGMEFPSHLVVLLDQYQTAIERFRFAIAH